LGPRKPGSPRRCEHIGVKGSSWRLDLATPPRYIIELASRSRDPSRCRDRDVTSISQPLRGSKTRRHLDPSTPSRSRDGDVASSSQPPGGSKRDVTSSSQPLRGSKTRRHLDPCTPQGFEKRDVTSIRAPLLGEPSRSHLDAAPPSPSRNDLAP